MLTGLWEVLRRGANTTSDIYFRNKAQQTEPGSPY